MQIKKQTENKLLGRVEVEATIAFTDGTPSRAKIRKELAKMLKSEESLVIVQKIQTNFGEGVANITANVYEKSETAKTTEGKHVQERHKVEASEETTEAPAETATEPAEEAAQEAETQTEVVEEAEADTEEVPVETEAEPVEESPQEEEAVEEAETTTEEVPSEEAAETETNDSEDESAEEVSEDEKKE